MVPIENGREVFRSNSFFNEIFYIFCSSNTGRSFCIELMFILFGRSSEESNTKLVAVLIGHILSGASTKQFIHYLQGIKSGKNRLKIENIKTI